MRFLMLFFTACHTAPSTKTPVESTDSVADSTPHDSVPETHETGDTASEVGTRCPVGMVPVPPEAPVFCIDAYENSLDADGNMVSVPSAYPLVNTTFDEARVWCAEMATVDENGATVGVRRLATWNEWRDAADGVIGEGGSPYPTGAEWPGEDCVVPGVDGTPVVDALQTTGDHPLCKSAVGTFDQLGNAWEWSDPQLELDIAAFIDHAATIGISFSIDADGGLWTSTPDLSRLKIDIAGMSATLAVAEDGRVFAQSVTFQAGEPFSYWGYIVDFDSDTDAHANTFLPIAVIHADSATTAESAVLNVRLSEDGAPVTAKVGCAWYVGRPEQCYTWLRFRGHHHEFRGTIGVRCTADPY